MNGSSRLLAVAILSVSLVCLSPNGANASATYSVSSQVTYRVIDMPSGVLLKSVNTPPGDSDATSLGAADSKGFAVGTRLSDGLELLAEAKGFVSGPPGFGASSSFGLARGSIQIENTTGKEVEIGLSFAFRLSIDLDATSRGSSTHGIAHLRVSGLSVARLTRNLAVHGPDMDELVQEDDLVLRLVLPGDLRVVTANLNVLASGVAQAVPEPSTLIATGIGVCLLGSIFVGRGRTSLP